MSLHRPFVSALNSLSLLNLGIHEARDLARYRTVWRLLSFSSATHSYWCILLLDWIVTIVVLLLTVAVNNYHYCHCHDCICQSYPGIDVVSLNSLKRADVPLRIGHSCLDFDYCLIFFAVVLKSM